MADGGEMGAFRDIRPGPENTREFREALGRFSTGVTVVTTQTSTGPIGITVNSFSSVSLDPPLIMWCVAKSSGRYPAFEAAERFAVHVLGHEHRDIAAGFAKSATAFEHLELAQTGRDLAQSSSDLAQSCSEVAQIESQMAQIAGETGENVSAPALFDDCLARFECTVAQKHDAGDHQIIVGRVDQAALREGDALVFCMGRFGRFLDA